MKTIVQGFLRQEAGGAAMEHALLTTFIGASMIAALAGFGEGLGDALVLGLPELTGAGWPVAR